MTTDTERLSSKAVRALNRELAVVGLRVCAAHQGHPLPLDDAHFYRLTSGYLETTCKQCRSQRQAKRHVERYHSDAAFRETCKEASRKRRARNLARRREQDRQRIQRRKAAALARVLEKVTRP